MKKVKLFTTIASLCLAVALMAFGVYAAQSVSATVTGSIGFTSTEVDVDVVSIKWYATNLSTAEGPAPTTADAALSLTKGENDKYEIGALSVTELAQEKDGQNVAKDAYIYIICTVKNDADTVAAKLNATITAADTQYSFTNPDEVNVPAKAQAVTITATIKFTPASVTTSGAAVPFEVLFTATK